MKKIVLCLVGLLLIAGSAGADVIFNETFDSGWDTRSEFVEVWIHRSGAGYGGDGWFRACGYETAMWSGAQRLHLGIPVEIKARLPFVNTWRNIRTRIHTRRGSKRATRSTMRGLTRDHG